MFGFQKKIGEVELRGEMERICVDCVQRSMIQQENTPIFLFLNCIKFPLIHKDQ